MVGSLRPAQASLVEVPSFPFFLLAPVFSLPPRPQGLCFSSLHPSPAQRWPGGLLGKPVWSQARTLFLPRRHRESSEQGV